MPKKTKKRANYRAKGVVKPPGRGTIGKPYTDMFGRTIGSKDRKQVNLQDTTQVANEDGTLTRTYYDYDGNVIQSKTTESAGASQAAAKRAGYTGDPVVAGEEYRMAQKNKALFAAASDKDAGNGTAETMPPDTRTALDPEKVALIEQAQALPDYSDRPNPKRRPTSTRTRRPSPPSGKYEVNGGRKRGLTAAQRDALRSSVFAKSGGKVKKKAGGKVKKKSGGAVGKAYTSRQNKKYGGGVYPKVGNTGD